MDENKVEAIENENVTEPKAETENKSSKDVLAFFKKCFAAEMRKKTIAILAALVVAVGAVWGLFSYMSPGSVAERFAKADYMENYVKMMKLCAFDLEAYIIGDDSIEEYFEEISDEYNEDIQSWKDYSEYSVKQNEEELEDWYGEYKITYEVSRIKDMSLKKLASEFEDQIEDLEEEGVFDLDEVSDAKIVNVKIKIKGEDETERMTYTIAVVKMGAMWKVLDYDYDWD